MKYIQRRQMKRDSFVWGGQNWENNRYWTLYYHQNYHQKGGMISHSLCWSTGIMYANDWV